MEALTEVAHQAAIVIKTHCLPVWGMVWGWIGYSKVHPVIHNVINFFR